MDDTALRVIQLQWRVVWLSLLCAGLTLAPFGASLNRSALSWDAAIVGVVVGCSGFQVIYALRQERIAGIQRSHLLWRGLSLALCLGGASLIVLGFWTLWNRHAAT